MTAGRARQRGRVATGEERREDIAGGETITGVAFSDTFQQRRSRDDSGEKRHARCRIFYGENLPTRDGFAMPRGRIVFASY